MYDYSYKSNRIFTLEPLLEPPCVEPFPERDCPDCNFSMQWNDFYSQFYCLQCEQYHDLPEPYVDCDDYQNKRYAYGY